MFDPPSPSRHPLPFGVALDDLRISDGASTDRARERGPESSSSRLTLDVAGAADGGLYYRTFRSEDEDLPSIVRLCEEELSEPLYTFRYFLVEWYVFPSRTSTHAIATIICKQDVHRDRASRGYIGMLSVDRGWRRRGIARQLVQLAIAEMTVRGAHEVALETEYNNAPSLALYGRLGFVREKRLYRFYSNGNDAFRLILPLGTPEDGRDDPNDDQAAALFPTELAAIVLRGPSHTPDADGDPQQLLPPPLPRRPERPSYIL
ncbi:N-alpha-acetyltransferase 30 [Cryptotrichosporon argae]